jgi:hypothetical protein
VWAGCQEEYLYVRNRKEQEAEGNFEMSSSIMFCSWSIIIRMGGGKKKKKTQDDKTWM